jgi:hypothetical protein
MIVGKMSNGDIVQIIRTAETVDFSPEKKWILLCKDFDKMFHKREQIKWVKAASLNFVWVKEFLDKNEV